MGAEHIRKYCKLDQESLKLLQAAVSNLKLSARGYHRLIKISRTIADLAGKDEIGVKHVAEAIQYRFKSE